MKDGVLSRKFDSIKQSKQEDWVWVARIVISIKGLCIWRQQLTVECVSARSASEGNVDANEAESDTAEYIGGMMPVVGDARSTTDNRPNSEQNQNDSSYLWQNWHRFAYSHELRQVVV